MLGVLTNKLTFLSRRSKGNISYRYTNISFLKYSLIYNKTFFKYFSIKYNNTYETYPPIYTQYTYYTYFFFVV